MESGDELDSDIMPRDLRNLRACKLCSLVKTVEHFLYYGCDNCEHLLKMRKNKALIDDFTSNTYMCASSPLSIAISLPALFLFVCWFPFYFHFYTTRGDDLF